MEKSEPSLVPEWLRNGTLGNNSSHLVPSPSHTDSASITRGRTRNSPKGLASLDPIRSSFLDRSSSSNSRKYFTNGSQKNAYSSFSRNHRDKDRDRLNLNGSWDHDSSDNMGVSFRRSHSMVARKHEDFPRNHVNTNGSTHKSVLEKDFPSLPMDEKQNASDNVRVSSPLLTEGWTSVLVDDPNTLNTINSSALQINGNGAMNMAEALTQAPPWPRASPQPSVQAQRREEIAIKQSKQLIPVTPSMPKLSSAKPLVRSSEVPAPIKQPHGKLFVLKPGWENGSLPKENTQTGQNKPALKPFSGERKPSPGNAMPGFTLEKKPSLSQTQSRNDFFNHLKKKTANSTLPTKPKPEPVSQNDAVSRAPEETFSEEETAFLRSLGWEENSGEEGLTEEEINSFYKEYMNGVPPAKKVSNLEEKVID